MKGESEVPAGALNLISINYPDHGHHGRLPLSRKNTYGRARNRTRDLVVSSQELWTPSHEAGHTLKSLWLKSSVYCAYAYIWLWSADFVDIQARDNICAPLFKLWLCPLGVKSVGRPRVCKQIQPHKFTQNQVITTLLYVRVHITIGLTMFWLCSCVVDGWVEARLCLPVCLSCPNFVMWQGGPKQRFIFKELDVGAASLRCNGLSNWVWLRLEIKQNHWSILKKSCISYQFRTDVQTYGHRPQYTTDDTADGDVCAQKC